VRLPFPKHLAIGGAFRPDRAPALVDLAVVVAFRGQDRQVPTREMAVGSQVDAPKRFGRLSVKIRRQPFSATEPRGGERTGSRRESGPPQSFTPEGRHHPNCCRCDWARSGPGSRLTRAGPRGISRAGGYLGGYDAGWGRVDCTLKIEPLSIATRPTRDRRRGSGGLTRKSSDKRRSLLTKISRFVGCRRPSVTHSSAVRNRAGPCRLVARERLRPAHLDSNRSRRARRPGPRRTGIPGARHSRLADVAWLVTAMPASDLGEKQIRDASSEQRKRPC
jgi:hypothetical protein